MKDIHSIKRNMPSNVFRGWGYVQPRLRGSAPHTDTGWPLFAQEGPDLEVLYTLGSPPPPPQLPFPPRGWWWWWRKRWSVGAAWALSWGSSEPVGVAERCAAVSILAN